MWPIPHTGPRSIILRGAATGFTGERRQSPHLSQEVVSLSTDQGLILREGTIGDATLIAAPPSTKNQARQRDPEMTPSKKGNQWHFGMKAHIGVDTAHGLVHTLDVTTSKVSDYSMAQTLLHGEEQTAHGDRVRFYIVWSKLRIRQLRNSDPWRR